MTVLELRLIKDVLEAYKPDRMFDTYSRALAAVDRELKLKTTNYVTGQPFKENENEKLND